MSARPPAERLSVLLRAAFDDDMSGGEVPHLARRIEEIAAECHCPDCRNGQMREGRELLAAIRAGMDAESGHLYADCLLLALLGDDELGAAFLALTRWYS